VRVELRPSAIDDIGAACDYYEAARPGLGEEFVEDLDRLFARLEIFPLSAQVVEGYEGVRRARLHRFPFGVFYRLGEADRIDVLRIVHSARSPEAWSTEASDE
jgi:toxin ParE1/3/4